MTLLRLDHDNVKKLIEGYEKQVEDIKYNSLQMAWYMRGGVSYTDIMNMSSTERKAISKIIDQNLETTKKSQLPFF